MKVEARWNKEMFDTLFAFINQFALLALELHDYIYFYVLHFVVLLRGFSIEA